MINDEGRLISTQWRMAHNGKTICYPSYIACFEQHEAYSPTFVDKDYTSMSTSNLLYCHHSMLTIQLSHMYSYERAKYTLSFSNSSSISLLTTTYNSNHT